MAGGGLDGESLRAQIRRAKELTDKPFGVNLMLMNPHIDDCAKVVVEEGVQVVTTGAGNPSSTSSPSRRPASASSPWSPPPFWPSAWRAWTIDGIIAEGTESGGHVGEATTMALVPAVVDTVDLPVIAAGGIADGRGMAAAFALAPAASRWAPACSRARSAPSTPTTRRRSSRRA